MNEANQTPAAPETPAAVTRDPHADVRVDAYQPRMAALGAIKRGIAEREAKALRELQAQIAKVQTTARADSDAAVEAAEAHASALSEALAAELHPRYFELARQFPDAPRKTAVAFKALIREHHDRARVMFGEEHVPAHVIGIAFAATIDRAEYMGAMGVALPYAVGKLVTAACKDEPGSAIESLLFDVEEAVHRAAKAQAAPNAERAAAMLRHASWRRHHASLEAFDATMAARKRAAEEARRPAPPPTPTEAPAPTFDGRGLAAALARAAGGA